jgi:hypothetical protein
MHIFLAQKQRKVLQHIRLKTNGGVLEALKKRKCKRPSRSWCGFANSNRNPTFFHVALRTDLHLEWSMRANRLHFCPCEMDTRHTSHPIWVEGAETFLFLVNMNSALKRGRVWKEVGRGGKRKGKGACDNVRPRRRRSD